MALAVDSDAVTTLVATAMRGSDDVQVSEVVSAADVLGQQGSLDDVVVVTAPDAWWGSQVWGAQARETRYGELANAQPSIVARSAAATCQAANADSSRGVVLTCDIGGYGATAGLCGYGAGVVTLLDAEAVADDRGWLAGGSIENAAEPELELAMRQAIRTQGRRVAVVLSRAAEVPRYRQTPVFDMATDRHRFVVTAAELSRRLERVAEAIRDALAGLLARHRALLPEVTDVYIIGDFGSIPSVRGIVADLTDGNGLPPVVLEPDAVVRGALRIAQGIAEVRHGEARSVMVSTHRVLGGRLVADRVPAVLGGAASAQEIGVPEQGGPRRIMLQIEDHDGRRSSAASMTPALPPGGYRIGWWPAVGGNGVIVFRPVDNGAAVFVPIPRADPEQGGQD